MSATLGYHLTVSQHGSLEGYWSKAMESTNDVMENGWTGFLLGSFRQSVYSPSNPINDKA